MLRLRCAHNLLLLDFGVLDAHPYLCVLTKVVPSHIAIHIRDIFSHIMVGPVKRDSCKPSRVFTTRLVQKLKVGAEQAS